MRYSNLASIGIFKTLFANIRFCKFKDAIHLPILVARNATIKGKKGSIIFSGGGKFGTFTVGFNRGENNGSPTVVVVKGKLILKGTGVHAFGAGCFVHVRKGAVLEIGDNFGCTGDSRLTVNESVVIGKDNLWSYCCCVMDGDGHQIFNANGDRINPNKGIVFGEHIWMGCNCLVLKGVSIPSNTIIAANSTIIRSYTQENTIITSTQVLRENIVWKR